ncbi:hypothetical protein SAMN05192539_1001332 [Paraburkholderia diazotrophica]|uniref:Transmembrane protein n=1 Tax=Paraburkholderia diazotrophica TaxID=667676 RepID=A0A1H6QTK1_9BURK|nr:hypothetical protein [Paraburkholderia diazotrophica]SEI42800.1 hypothetical protein SAMN05192539_1001332 [Paraburkholderia diazotrophica]
MVAENMALRAGIENAERVSSSFLSKLASLTAVAIGIFIAVTTVYGVFHFYSPIPWWDEWDGYIGFYKAITDGQGFHAWWFPHMEHRILTSRALFFMDLHFFHGDHIILFAAQQAMYAGIVVLMARAARRSEDSVSMWWVVGIAAALMFSWVQSEIMTWGFETQVIGAYFFATWALFEFTRPESSDVRRFVVGFILAACAEFTMGNGIAAPFALVVVAIFARQSLKIVALTLVIAIGLAAVYAIGYVKPDVPPPVVHGSPLLNRLAFIFAFLGNPFAILGMRASVCIAAGVVSALTMGALTIWLYATHRGTPYRAFLIGLCAFVAASSIAAMYGRGAAGAGAAFASRYTTGALVMWAAVLLLLFDVFRTRKILTMWAGIAVALVLATGQAKIFSSNDYLFFWKLGVLGPKIGLENTKYSGMLFPTELHDRFSVYTNYGAKGRIGIYDREWLRDAGEVKFDPDRIDQTFCHGWFEGASKDGAGAYTVTGWVVSPRQKNDVLVLLVRNGETVGYGISGERRSDVEKSVKGAPENAGWMGFSKAADSLGAYGFVDGKFCKLNG